MSEHALPDDFAAWPRDPYALLGLARGAAERDVKRAYTRLIKKFKPDSHPREFRRLRDAYEAILRSGGSSLRPMAPGEFVLETAASLWERDGSESDPQAPLEAKPPLPDPATAKSVDSSKPDRQIARAWGTARAGDVDQAYAELVALHGRFPADETVLLRLYWLTKVAPGIESGRSPRDWLVEAIARYGMAGRSGALYRQELDEDPLEAGSARCDRVLAALQHPGDILDLLERRWRGFDRTASTGGLVANSGWLATIMRDWQSVNDRLRQRDETVWGRTLLLAISHVTWSRSSQRDNYLTVLMHELSGAQHLNWRLARELDHFDAAMVAAEEWHREFKSHSVHLRSTDLASLKGDVIRLMRLSWLYPGPTILSDVGKCVRRILEQPPAALDDLQHLHKHCPQIAVRFLGLLESIPASVADEVADHDWSRFRVIHFASGRKWYEYGKFRHALYRFCAQEMIPPAQVAANLSGNSQFVTQTGFSLAQAVAADLALETVYRSWVLAWGL